MAIIKYIHTYVKVYFLRLINKEYRVNGQLVGVGTNCLRCSVVVIILPSLLVI